MNRKQLSLWLFIVLFIPLLVSAQKIDSMMMIYADKFPQEKVYLQFDKRVYNPGETIWYKAYLFTGFDPSPFSRNFYAEMYDASGNLLQRKTSPLSESTSAGSFEIPENFKGSRVHIRAYSTWMLNFDSSFVFEKDLRIAGIPKDSAGSSVSEASIHFFPEGGDLVAGIENDIAFKANDAYGAPVRITGSLHDASGKDLLEFYSTHDGMGKFIITPDKSDVFYATWKDEKGIEHRTGLPPVKASGVVLRALNYSRKLVFSVARQPDNATYEKLTVIAHMNQQLVYKAIVNLKDNFMSGGSIPVEQLPTGILQITVFDMNDNPLAERVVFVNNHNYGFDPKIRMQAKSVQRRGRNVLEIEVPDTLKCNMSLAVTDAEVDGVRDNDDNIVSRLLLTGDIHGYVKDPYYYFKNNSDTLAQQLDLVMLTHGWRRFRWDLVRECKTPLIKYPIQNYLSINADVLGVDFNRIAQDENLNLILRSKDSSTRMLDLPRITKGRFGVTGLIFFDTARAFYQFNVNRKLSNEAAVIFNTGLNNSPRKLRSISMTLPSWSPEDSLLIRKNQMVFVQAARLRDEEKKRVKTLETVTVTGRVKSDAEKLDETYTSGMFSGGDANTFSLLNDPTANAYLDIFNYLQGKVAGLQISTVGPTPSLSWRGGTPSLYLNEMQVDAEQLKSTPVSDVAMVKVFRPGSGVGFGGGAGGVIAVYTKKGSENKPDPSIKGLDQARLIGYSPVRQFYSPDYLRQPELEGQDVRTTLYWNPYILTENGNTKREFTFYNNDVTHKLRVVLEGFNEEGKLTHIEQIVE
ncbi:MAG: hypothetical protein Q8939_07860 [Bacteroidota bacterium]|nr:hypothetical protein [Bacteroidota bacterium]